LKETWKPRAILDVFSNGWLVFSPMLKTTLKMVLCLFVLSVPGFAQRAITGAVTSIIDGQTITVASGGGSNLKIRLISIETPDDGQQLSDIVTEHLAELALGKTIELRIDAFDDDAIFGRVAVGGIDLSLQMLRDGAAWYSEEYSLSPENEAAYKVSEQAAKSESRGVWGIVGLKRPSEIRKSIESVKDPLNDGTVSQLAWEQLGYSVEGIFSSESFTLATGNCSGTVVGIFDGDTVKIQTSSGLQTVRLASIDAPEKSQAFGMAAKGYLSALTAGKPVSCTSTKKDRYGRAIGQISLNGMDINLSMISGGYAWHYKEYQKEQSIEDRARYSQAELLARSSKVGLWQENHQFYPSEYRRRSFLARYYDPSIMDSAGAGYPSYSGGSQYSAGGSGPVRVRGYTRRDGTAVRSYTRSRPH
jgi:endonuclease YncB( thermonuclease family)